MWSTHAVPQLTGTCRQNQLQEDVQYPGACPEQESTGKSLAVNKTVTLMKLPHRILRFRNILS